MAGTQQFLVPVDLLHQIVKGGFDRCRCGGGFLLDRKLARGQPQVQGNAVCLVGRVLLDNGLQMHQFRSEHAQTLPRLVDLVADLFFDVGSFGDLVTDMNVHR